jgi:hemerythrin-like domain-containing protein
MSLQDIREILLDQHDALRVKIGEARRASELWRRGACPREDLQRLLAHLCEQLGTHHACEERLLRDILPTIADAWGKVRGERMVEGHAEEHRNLFARLDAATACRDAEEAAAQLKILLDSMLDHMRDEEQYLLASDVLTDDLRFGEGFAG